MRHLFVITILVAFSLACTKNSEEELYKSDCDTTLINYSIVKPIFEANCISCHNANLNYKEIFLYSYDNASAAAKTGRLVKAVNHLPGVTPMPYGGNKLPQCEVRKITLWIEKDTPK